MYLLFYYTTQLEAPIENIREELEQFQQAAASFQRVQELLDKQSQLRVSGQAVLPQGALSVKFEDVWFGYGEQSYLLRHLPDLDDSLSPLSSSR